MMKGLAKWICAVILFAFCIQGVSAGFTATSIAIIPDSEAVTASTPVTADATVNIVGQFGNGELDFATDLDKPQWVSTIYVNDIQLPQPAQSGKTLVFSGFLLQYKTGDAVKIRVTLTGTTPAAPGDKTILKIIEKDSNGNAVTSSQVIKTKTVVSQGAKDELIQGARTSLSALRSHIDEKAALDIDTSSGEAKYNEAKQKIDAASALAVTQISTIKTNVEAAKTAIADGEKALDKAWAQSEVDKAQVPINQVDAIIGWFKGNSSTANDQQLPAIIAKRENAVNFLSTANDEIASGNYAQARNKAGEAYNKGNESYNDAFKRKAEISDGINIGAIIGGIIGSGIMIVAVGLVVVVLVAVGIIIYRKRSRWDELG